jgi:hypothetical protein
MIDLDTPFSTYTQRQRDAIYAMQRRHTCVVVERSMEDGWITIFGKGHINVPNTVASERQQVSPEPLGPDGV